MEAVRSGLAAGSLVAVVGEPGLGKSLLLRTLKREYLRAGQEAVLLPGEARESARAIDIVLVDDADRVPAHLLHELARRARRCVLAGSDDLLATLGQLPGNPAVVQMQPLPPHDIGPYLQEQVERAGWPGTLLATGAVASLAHHSAGNPHMLQTLACRTLFLARLQEADQVSAGHVDLAVAHYRGTASTPGADALPCAAPVPVMTDAVSCNWSLPEALHPAEQQDASREGAAPALPLTAAADFAVPVPANPSAALPGRRGAFRLVQPQVMVPAGAMCCLALAGAVLISRHGQPPALMPAGVVVASARPVAPAAVAPPQAVEPAATASTAEPPPAYAAPFEPGIDPDPLPASQAEAAGSVPVPPATQALADRSEAGPSILGQSPGSVLPGALVQASGSDGARDPAANRPVPASTPPRDDPGTSGKPSLPQVAALPTPQMAVASMSRPSALPLHVVITVARNDPTAGSRGASLVSALEAAGLHASLGPAQPVPNETAVAYYYPSDQAAAAQVARQVGESGHERLVAPHGVPPRPGTVQVSVPPSRTPARPGHGKS